MLQAETVSVLMFFSKKLSNSLKGCAWRSDVRRGARVFAIYVFSGSVSIWQNKLVQRLTFQRDDSFPWYWVGYLDAANSSHMAAHLDQKDKIVCLQLQAPLTPLPFHTSPSAETLFQNNKECLHVIYKNECSAVASVSCRSQENIVTPNIYLIWKSVPKQSQRKIFQQLLD